jgi:hypothetical protein
LVALAEGSFRAWTGSVGAVSAVDVEDVTRDEPGFVRRNEDDIGISEIPRVLHAVINAYLKRTGIELTPHLEIDNFAMARNIRIEAREFLNQHCALALGLESILRAGPLKIVLQSNRAQAVVSNAAEAASFRYLPFVTLAPDS